MIALQALVIFVCVFGAALMIARAIVWIERQPDVGEGWMEKYLHLDTTSDMSGGKYLLWLLGISTLAGAWVFAVGTFQHLLPMNPEKFAGLTPLQALQTAVAVCTHTNLQPWAPETTLSIFTQSFAVLPTNILMGAVCIAAWRALVKALARQPLGNVWAGVWRGLLILVPLQIILTGILMSQGVPQNFWAAQMNQGPVASFVAGNLVSGAGAGWFGDNFASKIQNPTLVSDLACLTLLIALPLACCYAMGKLIARERLLERMALILVMLLALFSASTLASTPQPANWQHWAMSEAVWLNATAGSANGTVNAAIEHTAPAGRLAPFLTLLSGLPLPPAVGIGVGVLLMYFFVAVYLANLMVGRSPSFLGFKVGLKEVIPVAAGILGPQLMILIVAGGLIMTPQAHELIVNQGASAMSALMWMLGSTGQNNGSSFSLSLTQPVFVQAGIFLMIAGRILTLGAVVMFASALARQRLQPPVLPALEEKSPLMMIFWMCVMLVGAVLSMLPMIILGPLLEVFK